MKCEECARSGYLINGIYTCPLEVMVSGDYCCKNFISEEEHEREQSEATDSQKRVPRIGVGKQIQNTKTEYCFGEENNSF